MKGPSSSDTNETRKFFELNNERYRDGIKRKETR